MIWMLFVMFATLLVAFANGANDNFKGVATLFGSGTTNYKKALSWATLCTFLGSMAAMFLATKLLKTFSGKGLVPDSVVGEPAFIGAVILGAGLTVLFAAGSGIPISTTHSLIGALVGSGLVAVGSELKYAALSKNFFFPLLASPFIAILLTCILHFILHTFRKKLKIMRSGESLRVSTVGAMQLQADHGQAKEFATDAYGYQGRIWGVPSQKLLDTLHFMSAGAVSFARGLNDTPKIVALCLAAGALGLHWHVGFVGFAMAIGGLFGAKRVAETISHKITTMNHGQGFTANVVTASLVLFASHLGMPVSTTHVSCGSIFGLGVVRGQARWNVIGGIVSAWILTLPVAAGLAVASHWGLRLMGVS
jgi:inorganic phosphate transporter, PiT family